MSPRPIIDAGPGLNFFSLNRERLLIGTLGSLSAPEAVQQEVLRKAAQDRRFATAARVWRKLPDHLMQILSDDLTPELAAVVLRLSGLPMHERKAQSKDLGETMVIAHAVVAAETGETVTVLIDDGRGAREAASEIRRLDRLRAAGRGVGGIRLVNTLTVLESAAGTEHLPDKVAMRDLYQRLRGLDDGLPPIDATKLMSREVWVRG
ncbi:hypothetical protein AB0E69_14510 [Kribbella sp. NPDC026611]|uniref:hypothetical protein n=1 Tax=Kribbella sp. NPDC026611 TaxID=3154911 RepID=UPI0033C6BDEB